MGADAGEHGIEGLGVHALEAFGMFLVFAAATEKFSLLHVGQLSLHATKQVMTVLIKPLQEPLPVGGRKIQNG